MATPKGMRSVQFPVNATDAIHIYSDDTYIWLQVRRKALTEIDIGRSSFKVALCLTPGTAQKVALELQKVAIKNKEKNKERIASSTAKAKKLL